MAEKKTKPNDRLRAGLFEKLGDRWVDTLRVEVRADVLSWAVQLAEAGLEAERQEALSNDGGPTLMDQLNIAAKAADLDTLVNAVLAAPIVT